VRTLSQYEAEAYTSSMTETVKKTRKLSRRKYTCKVHVLYGVVAAPTITTMCIINSAEKNLP
jgi:hypothetical protein